jgi:O-antigen/teichoic acid export membrane protein
MALSRSFLFGIANSIGMLFVGLVVVPFYLAYLGVEAYGLVGFFVMTQSLLLLLDLGLAPTISREVARFSAFGKLPEVGDLLHSLATIYWLIAALIAVALFGFSSVIAEHWLQTKTLPTETLSRAIVLMGIVIACRWPAGLYRGALVGAEKLVIASIINLSMMTVANVGAVAVLAFVSPTIEAFFIWQGGVGLTYAITMRAAAWNVIGRPRPTRFSMSELKRVWRFTAGMSLIVLTGLILTQLDKVLLSKLLVLDEFGIYMLATVVVSGLYALISPIFSTVNPRMSMLVANGEIERLTDLYQLSTRFLCVIVFPVSLILVVFPEELVFLWTGNLELAKGVAPILMLLAIGTSLHGVMHIPYALQLAYGLTRIPLKITLVLLIVMVPMVVVLTQWYGARGGAMAWLILQIIYVLLGTYLTHREVLKGVGRKWLLQDVGIPIVVASVVGWISHYLVQGTGYSAVIDLALAIAMSIVTALLIVLASPRLLPLVLNTIKARSLAF